MEQVQQDSQQVHNTKTTLYQRRCDVMMSHRRWYDFFRRHVPAANILRQSNY